MYLQRVRTATLIMCVFALVLPCRAHAQQVLTLDEALREAREANAHLPVAALNAAIARAQVNEARARLGPRIVLDGDVRDGVPSNYTTGDARLQVIATDTLLDGGRLRANLAISRFQSRAAAAGYRAVIKDVELNVRLQFAEALRAQTEVDVRQAGIGRLRAYLTSVEARRAAGEGVAVDVIRTRSRLATELANIADAERRFDAAQLQLNNLTGRPMRTPLKLAELPAPSPPPKPVDAPWLQVPDILQAQALTEAARKGITVAKADRLPQLSISADAGLLPTFGPTGAGLNNGHGGGGALTLFFTLPIFDMGIYRSRLTQARLAAQQAADSAYVVRRESELAWSQAVELGDDLYREVQLRAANVPLAQDAYLVSESLYRGAAATSLEVLDAYSAWIDAQLAHADAVLQYRQTEANLLRWGTP